MPNPIPNHEHFKPIIVLRSKRLESSPSLNPKCPKPNPEPHRKYPGSSLDLILWHPVLGPKLKLEHLIPDLVPIPRSLK